jgi:hypothetical protein
MIYNTLRYFTLKGGFLAQGECRQESENQGLLKNVYYIVHDIFRDSYP